METRQGAGYTGWIESASVSLRGQHSRTAFNPCMEIVFPLFIQEFCVHLPVDPAKIERPVAIAFNTRINKLAGYLLRSKLWMGVEGLLVSVSFHLKQDSPRISCIKASCIRHRDG